MASARTRSRALLMREYLRRAALWAKEYGVEEQFVIRTPDGVVFVPRGGKFTPEGTA
ncbi:MULTISPECIES: hypothetical protein [unclassified Streptomyces]|uniref:hypothetical protein n=1 Tax=unclassified Streptomyces TaxID=2593676 RepID=UPI003D90FF81